MLANGVALIGGELAIGAFVRVIYDGTQFLLVDPAPIAIADGQITAAKLSTGHPEWTSGGTLKAVDMLVGTNKDRPVFRYDLGFTSAIWREGAGVPSSGLGNDGDFYLRTS